MSRITQWMLLALRTSLLLIGGCAVGDVDQSGAGQVDAGKASDPLYAAAATLLDAVEGQPGFTGLSLEDQTLLLWWHGHVDDAANAAVVEASKTAKVEVRSTPYALADLESARTQMMSYIDANPGVGLHSITIPVEGTRLIVGSDAPSGGFEALSRTAPNVGIPVDIVSDDRVQRMSRTDDGVNGGAQIKTPTGDCTSGVPVLSHTGLRLNWVGVLTADHCAPHGGPIKDGKGRLVGFPDTRTHSGLHDILAYQTGNHIGDGIYEDDHSALSVSSLGPMVKGFTVNWTGFVGGKRKDWLVKDTNYTFRTDDGVWSQQMARASGVGRPPQRGDSGGPAYTIDGGLFGLFPSANAVGILSGGAGRDAVFGQIRLIQKQFAIR